MTTPKEYRQGRFQRRAGSAELLLIRHGESLPVRDGQVIDSVDGHDDPDLDPVGVEQAERVAGRLRSEAITAIYVTPLRRTHQTAAPLAAELGVGPTIEPDLREVFLGSWEGGLFRRNMVDGHPLAAEVLRTRRWDVIPGAEPGSEFAERVERGITRVAETHPDETVAVFAHGGTIAQALAIAVGSDDVWSFLSDNASISQLVVEPGRWTVRRFNDTCHLGAAYSTAPEPLT